jgi:hypothetical protein
MAPKRLRKPLFAPFSHIFRRDAAWFFVFSSFSLFFVGQEWVVMIDVVASPSVLVFTEQAPVK